MVNRQSGLSPSVWQSFKLTLVSDQPALAVEQSDEPEAPGLPDECEQIDAFVHRDTISFYANDHPDRTAGARSVNNGSVVILGVLEEHLEDVRRELTTPDTEPCLEVVQYSTAELSSAQDLLRSEDLNVPIGPVLTSSSGNAFNRLAILIAVADRQTIEMIASHFDDPAILLVFGHGEILE